MQAILSGKLSYLLVLVFPIIFIASFLMQNIVLKMRKELYLAKYKMERGPIEEMPKMPDPEDVLPGYKMMTFDDYNDIINKIKEEDKKKNYKYKKNSK